MTSRSAGQGSQALTWDDAGRLTAITGGTAGNSSFLYGADGNLLLQKDPGAATLYLPGEQLALNTSTQAVTGIRYYPLPGGGTAYRTGTATSTTGYEIADQNGTNLLTLDYTAQVPAWRQETPYGAPRGSTAQWIDNRGFLNKPADPATGLDIIGARQYDPLTGRFTSPDPLLEPGSPQQLNGYSYAAGNPVTGSDPTGLSTTSSACSSNITYCLNQEYQQEGGQYNAQGIPTGAGISTAICYYCRDYSDYPTTLPQRAPVKIRPPAPSMPPPVPPQPATPAQAAASTNTAPATQPTPTQGKAAASTSSTGSPTPPPPG